MMHTTDTRALGLSYLCPGRGRFLTCNLADRTVSSTGSRRDRSCLDHHDRRALGMGEERLLALLGALAAFALSAQEEFSKLGIELR
jgi:hypothetical protein